MAVMKCHIQTREDLLCEISRILQKATADQLRKVLALISALDK